MRNIACDLRRADDPSVLIAERRDRQRHFPRGTVLSKSNGLVRLYILAAANAAEDLALLGDTVSRHDRRYRATQDLTRRVAKDRLGAVIPACDHAVEVFADHRVLRR